MIRVETSCSMVPWFPSPCPTILLRPLGYNCKLTLKVKVCVCVCVPSRPDGSTPFRDHLSHTSTRPHMSGPLTAASDEVKRAGQISKQCSEWLWCVFTCAATRSTVCFWALYIEGIFSDAFIQSDSQPFMYTFTHRLWSQPRRAKARSSC